MDRDGGRSLNRKAPGPDPAPAPRRRLRLWIGLPMAVVGLLGITPMWGIATPGSTSSTLHILGSTLLTLAGVVVLTYQRLPPPPEPPRD